MSRQEKHAWFNIGVFAVASILFLLTYRRVGVLPATAWFGLCGFWGIATRLFYPKGAMAQILDEREKAIARRSWQAGHGVFWGLFVLGVMRAWGLHRGGEVTIPADILPLFVFGGMIVVVLVQSIAMLVLSRTGIEDAEA